MNLDSICGYPDYESMRPAQGFSIKFDDWYHAYTREQATKGLQTWFTSFNRASAGFEVWLLKPLNDGAIHARCDLKADLSGITQAGNHIMGIAQDITAKANVASFAYAICEAFAAADGQIISYKWTATPRRPEQPWQEFAHNNVSETLAAIRNSGIEARISPADRPYLYYKLNQVTQKGDVAYTVSEVLDPSCGEHWEAFMAESGLLHLQEVVSLDTRLCPGVLHLEKHIAYRYVILCDSLEYLLSTQKGKRVKNTCQLLAAIREPQEADLDKVKNKSFVFKGFDLLEDFSGVSRLLNGNAFTRAFAPSDVNEFGLVSECADAYRIQKSLWAHYGGDPHANCAVWAIWRAEG